MPQTPQIDRLIAEVAARHGILLKKDDAAFALVTLNQLVLEDMIAGLAAQTRKVVAEFESAHERVQTRAGKVLATNLRQAVEEIQNKTEKCIEQLHTPTQSSYTVSEYTRWALLFVVGLALGIASRWVF